MEDKLITLKTFTSVTEAHLAKTQLESEGIKCVLFDENVANLSHFFSEIAGGVKLKIMESDQEKALSILSLNSEE
jgi:hypothetical protein